MVDDTGKVNFCMFLINYVYPLGRALMCFIITCVYFISICHTQYRLFMIITKTCKCNMQGNFSALNIENFIGKILIFLTFLLKYSLWVHLRIASARRL